MDHMNYHGTNRSSIVTEVDFFKAISDTETPSDTLADGPLAINWKTDVAKGTSKSLCNIQCSEILTLRNEMLHTET